jgi:hypothetical protein
MDITVAAASVLAEASPVGAGILTVLGPIIVFSALAVWLGLTIMASHRKQHPERRHDQSPHRGPMEGGLYRYRPGMFSHSYAPGRTRYHDENR